MPKPEQDDSRLFGRALMRHTPFGLGESVTSGARRAADRLEDRGVAASDFKSPVVTWSPPSIGFSGEVQLAHKLGRVPKGILLVSQTFPFRWSVPAAQKAKWTASSVFLFVPDRHVWEVGETTIPSGTVTGTYTFETGRESACDVNLILSQRDNTATDRPPVKIHSLTTALGFVTAASIRYGDESTKAWTTQIHAIVTTDLHTADEFSFLIV